MASKDRYVFQSENVTVNINSKDMKDCTIQLHTTEIRFCQQGGSMERAIAISQISSIQVHQPIFGANYISGEYQDKGSKCTFTMTFNRGGATEFASAFFRVTEGELVTTESVSEPPPTNKLSKEDKKNL